MADQIVRKSRAVFSPLGYFLIIVGIGLLGEKLGVWSLRDHSLMAGIVGVLGLLLIVEAAISRRSGFAFFGGLLFFLGAAIYFHHRGMYFMPWDWPAAIALVFAGAFLVLYLFDPRRIGVLVPVVFFGGLGTLYYLWWHEILEWYDVRMIIRTYWPVLLILWGLGFLVKPFIGRRRSGPAQ